MVATRQPLHLEISYLTEQSYVILMSELRYAMMNFLISLIAKQLKFIYVVGEAGLTHIF